MSALRELRRVNAALVRVLGQAETWADVLQCVDALNHAHLIAENLIREDEIMGRGNGSGATTTGPCGGGPEMGAGA